MYVCVCVCVCRGGMYVCVCVCGGDVCVIVCGGAGGGGGGRRGGGGGYVCVCLQHNFHFKSYPQYGEGGTERERRKSSQREFIDRGGGPLGEAHLHAE